MNDVVMTKLDSDQKVRRLLIAAIVMGFASLASPWWMMFVLINNEMVATFNLFLWGVIEAGFLQASLPFEWFSYVTFIVVVIGAFLGLGGYEVLATSRRKGRLLIICECACTIGGCVFYVSSLVITFANPVNPYWMIAPSGNNSGLFIAALDVFSIRHHLNIVIFEFLSIGVFLAAISSILSLIASYKLEKNTPTNESSIASAGLSATI